MGLLKDLRDRAGVYSLLSGENSNPKVAKSQKDGILSTVLHLAPGNMSGHEVCPKRSAGCTAACLHFAGSPVYMTIKTTSRIKKTKLFFENRNLFMNILVLEIVAFAKRAARKNMTPAIRLNGTSDICYEIKKFILFPEVAEFLKQNHPEADLSAKTIDKLLPAIQFYDYTAIPNRRGADNYHLTFSMKEDNLHDVIPEMLRGLNIAVVFPTSDLPSTFNIGGHDVPVIDGDETDYRPGDIQNCVIGLKVKGKLGKADLSGFVQMSHSDLLAA